MLDARVVKFVGMESVKLPFAKIYASKIVPELFFVPLECAAAYQDRELCVIMFLHAHNSNWFVLKANVLIHNS